MSKVVILRLRSELVVQVKVKAISTLNTLQWHSCMDAAVPL